MSISVLSTACAPASPPTEAGPAAAPARSSLEHFLDPLRALLCDEQVTELCINRPGELFIETYSGWQREARPHFTFEWCLQLARLVANATGQRISAQEPLLSATLPTGARIQVVIPPAAEPGTVSLTIRRPASQLWTLEDLAQRGVVDGVHPLPRRAALPQFPREDLHADERELLALWDTGAWVGFLRRAVQLRKNILLSGATGSGKTTVAKALILEVPADDRILSIEDTPELSLVNQPNHVRMFYSQGGQGQADVSAGDLLVSMKRQRPDRVFVSEVRSGEEVYHYLVSIASGHPGSITSAHADSAEGAFLTLAQLMKHSAVGQGLATREGIELAQLHIDVVVQCHRERQHRRISEVWYDPTAKRRGLA
jgi:type IV secretion system protein VirB11